MPRVARIRVRVLASIAVALLAWLTLGGPVAAAAIVTTTTLDSIDPVSPIGAFVPFTVYGSVDFGQSISVDPSGTLSVHDHINGGDVVIGSTAFVYNTQNHVTVLGGLDLGTHPLTLVYAPNDTTDLQGSESSSTDYVVHVTSSFVDTYAPSTIETHHGFQIQGAVGASTNSFYQSATMDFMWSGSATPLCNDVAVDAGNLTLCKPASLPVGTWDLWVVYSGNTWVTGSTSAHVQIVVTADTVDAHGIGVQYSSIYPVIDAYRDTDKIQGVRDELISVAIRIYNSGNSLVKSASIASGSGAYAYAWNGRNSAGTILAEGQYKVVQTLKDTSNTTKAFTNYITLSKKHLIYHTVYIAKLGSSISASGHVGTATVSLNTTSGFAKLSVPGIYSNWAGVGYQFTIPSATVYKSMHFQVYGHHTTVPDYTSIGAQNFSTCAYVAGAAWDESCFGGWTDIHIGTTNAWTSSAFLGSAYRYGHTVRGLVSSYTGTTYVYKVQLKVYYATLGY